MRVKMTFTWLVFCLVTVLITAPLWAQIETELAKKTQNPWPTGDYNRMIDQRIADIKITCGMP